MPQQDFDDDVNSDYSDISDRCLWCLHVRLHGISKSFHGGKTLALDGT